MVFQKFFYEVWGEFFTPKVYYNRRIGTGGPFPCLHVRPTSSFDSPPPFPLWIHIRQLVYTTDTPLDEETIHTPAMEVFEKARHSYGVFERFRHSVLCRVHRRIEEFIPSFGV